LVGQRRRQPSTRALSGLSKARRVAIACALVVAGVTALSNQPAQARSEVKPPPLVGGHYERLQAGRVVDVRQLGSHCTPQALSKSN
jgi:hypothetical protein